MDKRSGDERYYSVETVVKIANMKFCTILVTAGILAIGLIVAAHVYGRGQATGTSSVSTTAAQTSEKMMDSDMKMEVGLMKGDGQMMMERISYDRDANVVLIDTPGNFHRNNSATKLAFDVDRSVVFTLFIERDECVAYKLSSQMASELKEHYLQSKDDSVVDLSTASFDETEYEVVGVVPDDYIRTANGVIIRGLCAGKKTTWVKQTASSMRDGASRRKRGRFSLGVSCRCPSWFNCNCGLILNW